uniref:Glutathione peroxidase n=2 Tax=Ostariophysi TaxID=32519 RepID=A0A8B9GWS6_ASTMX
MTFIAKTFYDLRATTLEGESVDFNVFRGRVVLIENVASL